MVAKLKALVLTKTFWVGVGLIVSGAGLLKAGHLEGGLEMIGFGLLAMAGRDYGEKVLKAIRKNGTA